jgi:NitT/TauT family transport system ATP-binding protein
MSGNNDKSQESPLRLTGVARAFGPVAVLDDISLSVKPGEFVVIVGPSGCGKTTLLNLLSGHDKPTSGNIRTSGLMRRVYQHDGLFPWRTVADNIELGLRAIKDPAERKKQLAELLALIRLEPFAGHYPHQLSGGMKQRVEIARALAGYSDILLMDEPFSALDYQTRLRMRRELVRILHERPRTVVFVTHDIEEAAQLADRIIVLSDRPARIQASLTIDLPRPRVLTHPVVIDAVEKILNLLGLQDAATDAGALDRQDREVAETDPSALHTLDAYEAELTEQQAVAKQSAYLKT